MTPKWLEWARSLQAISQTGLHYAQNEYDRERYEAIREIGAEILAGHAGVDKQGVLELWSKENGYATPKVDVRGVVFRDDGILLVRETLDEGRWTLPGGWADVNESPSEAVEREVREESGFETRAVKLLAAYDRDKQGHAPPFPFHIYKLFFLCDIVGGQAQSSHETSDAAFFPADDLPELSVSRVTAAQIRRCFAHRAHPDWPSDFD
ncbi:MAG: NUDIX hydrolase [Phycisphaerae bacterium]|nr:NUDIX hydrolase [Phycisphaerae bacterium]